MGPRTGCWIAVSTIAAVICAVGAAQGEAPPQQQTDFPQWEYKLVIGDANACASNGMLNELGTQGWELISANPDGFILKRPSRS